jgi:hypothetical protein
MDAYHIYLLVVLWRRRALAVLPRTRSLLHHYTCVHVLLYCVSRSHAPLPHSSYTPSWFLRVATRSFIAPILQYKVPSAVGSCSGKPEATECLVRLQLLRLKRWNNSRRVFAIESLTRFSVDNLPATQLGPTSLHRSSHCPFLGI